VAMLAFFAVGATLSLSLNERQREFGTRVALGERRSTVALGILAEASLLGLVGLAAGAVAALAVAFCVNASGGIPMAPAPGLSTALRIRLLYSPQGALLSVALCLLVPPVAAAFPARSILRMSVVTLLNRGRRS
jgi:putative ABC transport system permease protein